MIPTRQKLDSFTRIALAIGALCTAAAASSAVGDQEAARLGKELTPAGGEVAASKDGSIPAWGGVQPPNAGWSFGRKRFDFWPYKGDKALFWIDASNVDKYADKLSPGQIALIKQTKGYRMDVYPSRRDCGVPDFVAENTRKNVGAAKISADGWSLSEAVVPGYPFPLPASGIEAMWNAKMRYRGIGVELKNTFTSVSPRKGSNEWIKATGEITLFYPWAAKGAANLSKLPPIEFYTYFAYSTPAALAGQAISIGIYLNQPGSETFYYFPGQRRVRRMPSYAYDAPQIGFENQYTIDEAFVFSGALDRFDWKLAGKREMYVPYNSFGAYDFTGKFEDVVQN